MSTPTRSRFSADEIHSLLQRWQREGLLDAGEVTRIEAAEASRAGRAATPSPARAPAAEPRSGGLIAEALGYVGGALLIAAIMVLLGREWHRLQFGAQVSLVAGAAVVVLVAALFVPERAGAAGARLRAVLWTLSTGLAFGTWMLVAGDDGFAWSVRERLLFAASLAAVQAGLLWWRSRATLLHVATFAALTTVAAAGADYATFLRDGQASALGAAVFAIAWVLLALAGVVRPPMAACLAGSLVAVGAAQATTETRWGGVFVLGTAAAVIALAVWRRSLAVLAVGTFGVLMAVPAAADRLFPGSLGVAFGLLVAGLVLIASALWITRHRAMPE